MTGRAPGDPGNFEGAAYGDPHEEERVLEEALGPMAEGDAVIPPPDYVILSAHIEEFMYELYGFDRYAYHNDRILRYHERYSENGNGGTETGENGDGASENGHGGGIDQMAIILHDFVEHAILNPEQTAVKAGLLPEQGSEIRSRALGILSEVYAAVDDKDALTKAYLFAIDTSEWEAEARKWRGGAIERVDHMVAEGAITERHADILRAAIDKTKGLEGIETGELEGFLRQGEHYLADLRLERISEVTLNHNMKGLYFKALETLDLITHPPADNPASTYRDCTEAINFFVPALMGLGYKQLAIDLRDVALRWFFDDPEGHAHEQHELSAQHFDDIKARVMGFGLLEAEARSFEATTEARVKSEGSLREKLARPGYEGIHQAPDGVGFAFVVPDHLAGAEMTAFARAYQHRLINDTRIVAGHPRPGETDFDDMQGERKKKSGYEAVHMTFYYHPPGRPGVRVPFEIQVLTQEQYRMKVYGPFSDLVYKDLLPAERGGVSYSEAYQPHLEHLERRAQADRELAPGSTVQSIAKMLAVSPEFPNVFNSLLRAVDVHGTRALVPPELQEAVRDLPAEIFGEAGDLTVLPANFVTPIQFLEAISMFGKELASDKHVLSALEMVRKAEAGSLRRDGKTPVLEGHILPTALSAVMLAIQTGKIWSEEFGPIEHISNIATIALLHDYVEKELEHIDDVDVKMATRQSMLYEIKRDFGETVMDGVEALTVPVEIEDEVERRDQYTRNILSNVYASIIKPADRLQNHLTDMIRFVTGDITPATEDGQKSLQYLKKTDRHLSEQLFTADMTDAYYRVQRIIWELGRRFGYEAASN